VTAGCHGSEGVRCRRNVSLEGATEPSAAGRRTCSGCDGTRAEEVRACRRTSTVCRHQPDRVCRPSAPDLVAGSGHDHLVGLPLLPSSLREERGTRRPTYAAIEHRAFERAGDVDRRCRRPRRGSTGAAAPPSEVQRHVPACTITSRRPNVVAVLRAQRQAFRMRPHDTPWPKRGSCRVCSGSEGRTATSLPSRPRSVARTPQ